MTDRMAIFARPLIVKAVPYQQSEVGYRMKPGDAVTIEWPGPHDLRLSVSDTGDVIVAGVAKGKEAEA